MTPMKDFFGMPWLPINVSAHGAALDDFLVYIHWLMLVLFIGWGTFFLYTLFRFRASKNPRANYRGVTSHTGTYLEVTVALVEVILLIGFSIPLWSQWADAFPKPKDSLNIRVVAEQFQWNFHYPGKDGIFGRTDAEFVDVEENPLGIDPSDRFGKDDIYTQRLFLEEYKPTITHITAKDVIHSFGIPVMRVKQDAIPGSVVSISFTPTKAGKYLIVCSQLCGTDHATMSGYVEVLSQEDFAQWKQAKETEKGEELQEEEEDGETEEGW